MAAPFPQIEGEAEFIRLVAKHRWPVLATTEFVDMPGAVLRPLVDPVPLALVSMVWRRGLRHPGLTALHEAVTALAAAGRWLHRPARSWLPDPDAYLAALPDPAARPAALPDPDARLTAPPAPGECMVPPASPRAIGR